MDKKPLAGKRILITRARDQSAEFATRLRDLGADVIEFPTIDIVAPLRWRELDRAIDQLRSYDWVIFTSVNGVKFFWQRLTEKVSDPCLPPSLRVCAIGPATANQLKKNGIKVDYTPKEYVAEAVLEGFGKMAVKGNRILLARARVARDLLPKGLEKMGAEVDVVEAYRTVKPRGGSKRLKKVLTDMRIDVITFTSSSTVNHFAGLLNKEEPRKLLRGVAIACIGPITARTVKDRGMDVQIQPKEYTTPALSQAIIDFFSPPSPFPKGKKVGTRGRK